MKSFSVFSLPLLLAVTACGSSVGEGMMMDGVGAGGVAGGPVASNCRLTAQTTSTDPAVCVSMGKVPVYSNRFSKSCGSSSVVSGADALSGKTPGTNSATPSAPSAAPPSAMTVSCGDASCSAGQVAVVQPTMGNSAGSAGATQCVAAPPSCPDGQSPQYVFTSSMWQCTDCSVVITYGGTYGNYTRCASAPAISCQAGQVPTWVYEDERWECKDTCNNGQYDQHEVNGSTICVPC